MGCLGGAAMSAGFEEMMRILRGSEEEGGGVLEGENGVPLQSRAIWPSTRHRKQMPFDLKWARSSSVSFRSQVGCVLDDDDEVRLGCGWAALICLV